MQISPVFTFANQAGLDMLETTLVALQDIMLDKVLDEAGRKVLLSEFSKIMQQVRVSIAYDAYLFHCYVFLYYNIHGRNKYIKPYLNFLLKALYSCSQNLKLHS